MNIKKTAGLIQGLGRNGDTMLAHINPEEARMLKAAGGSGTINPETGLHEFGFFKSLFKAVAVGAAIYFTGGAAAGALGLTGAAASAAVTGAAIGGGVSAFQGGSGSDIVKGALIGGIGGFVAGGGLSDVSNWMTSQATPAASQSVGQAAGNITGEAAKSVASSAATQSGISAAPKDFLMASPEATQAATEAARQTATQTPQLALNQVAGNMPTPAVVPPPPSGGFLSTIGTWAEKNPTAALMAGNAALSGIGGIMTAGSAEEQAKLDREAALQARMVQGGWGANANAVTAADPNQAVDMNGRYIRGPLAGQYRARPGLINATGA